MEPQVQPNQEQLNELKRIAKMIPTTREDKAAIHNAYRLFVNRNQGSCADCAVGRLHMELIQLLTKHQHTWEEALREPTPLEIAQKQVQEYRDAPTAFRYGKRDIQKLYGKRVSTFQIKEGMLYINQAKKPWKSVDEFTKEMRDGKRK